MMRTVRRELMGKCEGTPFLALSVGLQIPSLHALPSESHVFRCVYELYIFKMCVPHIFSVTLTGTS